MYPGFPELSFSATVLVSEEPTIPRWLEGYFDISQLLTQVSFNLGIQQGAWCKTVECLIQYLVFMQVNSEIITVLLSMANEATNTEYSIHFWVSVYISEKGKDISRVS